MGIAILGSVLNAAYRHGVESSLTGLPQQVAEGVKSSIAFAQQAAEQLNSPDLAKAAESAFVDAMGNATLVAAGLLVVGALFVGIRAPRKGEQTVVG